MLTNNCHKGKVFYVLYDLEDERLYFRAVWLLPYYVLYTSI